MEDILRKIEENTAPKDLFQLMISKNTTDFITRFNPPLQLKKRKTVRNDTTQLGNLLFVFKDQLDQ